MNAIDDVGLLRERVALIGLGRQAVAQEVEQQDATAYGAGRRARREVVRRAREAVQHEQRFVALLLERGATNVKIE